MPRRNGLSVAWDYVVSQQLLKCLHCHSNVVVAHISVI